MDLFNNPVGFFMVLPAAIRGKGEEHRDIPLVVAV
jgi:hypothetical protein